MSIEQKDVEKVLKLSELNVSDEEKKELHGQMSRILGYMDKINELDLKNVEPTSYSNTVPTFLRKDEVKKTSISLQTNAPHWEGNAFGVPSILGT
ncbi:Asp-tRNA(Asn)/Glu-tRNA(Gln) amidotransferase subunit GatC [bacterium]|jgi:aspartyl-tRNA(Asn)/glutamyl-tRNA(Gln) amidotransferase subunit C|nr:Asp-tRNA(Asn)/Glu-tRNA(Gln) amidotransferase subunit GatC [bacterium]